MNVEVETHGGEQVRLEAKDGRCWFIRGACTLGRAPTNQVILESPKISRRHALIHPQGPNEYWLVDLASSNGSYVNGRRVTQPTLLREGDLVGLGEYQLVFRQPQSGDAQAEHTTAGLTLQEMKLIPCWLLLVDVISSTMIVQHLAPEDLPQAMRHWLVGAKDAVEHNNGIINKFLGDGFLAYWPHQESTGLAVAKALGELKQLQVIAEPPFRVVVHYGQVNIGGAAAMAGEECLVGQEVNRAFRMEKLAGKLGHSSLMSAAAQALLAPHLTITEIGQHILPGFEKAETFYEF